MKVNQALLPVIPAYPEQPYMATHVVKFESGFQRDLVPYGAPCGHYFAIGGGECRKAKTYLDAGRPACKDHLLSYCKHGKTACHDCGKIDLTMGRTIRRLSAPRRARPLK